MIRGAGDTAIGAIRILRNGNSARFVAVFGLLAAARGACAEGPASQPQPLPKMSVALLEAEYITPDAKVSRSELTGWLDTVLTDSLAQQPELIVVDRQALAKVLDERNPVKLDAQTADARLKPFIASGVLICPMIIADPTTHKAVVTVQAVLPQRGTLLAEIVVTGELAGDGWKTPPSLAEALKPFWTELQLRLTASLGKPCVEINRINLTGKLGRLQWLADDLTDDLGVASYAGIEVLVPRQAVHTKEERLLRLMGLSAAAENDRSAKLAAASDWQLGGELADDEKPGVPFDQIPVTLALHISGAGNTIASTTLRGTVGEGGKLRQQACDWAAQELLKASHAPAQPLDESHASVLAKQELGLANRLLPISYGQGRLETDRQERLALAALRACHLDPTSEEAAFLATTTIEGLYEARGQQGTLACKDRILELGQLYLDRFADKVADHHRLVLAKIGSAGQSAAFMLRGKPGGTDAILGPPDERQYGYARAYVRAWMETGIRGLTDKRYRDSNALQSAPGHLQLHLIPNIPDDKLDAEYGFWRDTWSKRLASAEPGTIIPWERIDVAFQARRKDPAAVRKLLQKLAEKYPQSNREIWRLLADDIIPLYLHAAGDKEWQTWKPTWPATHELVTSPEDRKRFYWRLHVDPPLAWDLTRAAPIPFDNHLNFDAKVLETGNQRYLCPYPRIQPLFVGGGQLWFITPGLWDTINLKQSHTLFTVPLAEVTGRDVEVHANLRAVQWPNDADQPGDAPPALKIVTCWLAAPTGKTVWIGTAGQGVVRFTMKKDAWQGVWMARREGLPAGEITAIKADSDPAFMRIEGLGEETRQVDSKGRNSVSRKAWAVRCDAAGNKIELLPEHIASPVSLPGYVRVATESKDSPDNSRQWAVQAGVFPHGDHWDMGELDPHTGKFLPGSPLLGAVTSNSFLPSQVPLQETRMVIAVADTLMLGSFQRLGEQPLANRGEAVFLSFYRPAPTGATSPAAADHWIGPFLAPDHGLIFGMLNDGTGNIWLTTDKSVYRLDAHTLLSKLPAGQSTEAYRAADREVREHADWRVRVSQLLAEARGKDALKIVEEILAPLAAVDVASSPERREDWAIAMLYKATVFAASDKSLPESIPIFRQVIDTAWASPAARREAADTLLTQLQRTRRWQELLDAADAIHPYFPHLIEQPEPEGYSNVVKAAKAKLKPVSSGEQ